MNKVLKNKLGLILYKVYLTINQDMPKSLGGTFAQHASWVGCLLEKWETFAFYNARQ